MDRHIYIIESLKFSLITLEECLLYVKHCARSYEFLKSKIECLTLRTLFYK